MNYRVLRSRRRIVVMALPLLAACSKRSAPSAATSPFASTDLSGVDWGKDFHLTDHHGRARSVADYRGQVILLFFGYTHCPDVCPISLSRMAQLRAHPCVDGARIQGLFVTLDPERDTRQVLAQYVPAFDSTFLGLFGTPNETAVIAKDFKLFHEQQKPEPSGSYLVDHTGGIYVFDTLGRLRLRMRPADPIDGMVSDLALLMKATG